jgi:hypothetical protein
LSLLTPTQVARRWENTQLTNAGSVYAHSHTLWPTPAYSVERGCPPVFRSAAMRSRDTAGGTVVSASPWKSHRGVPTESTAASLVRLAQQATAAAKSRGRCAPRPVAQAWNDSCHRVARTRGHVADPSPVGLGCYDVAGKPERPARVEESNRLAPECPTRAQSMRWGRSSPPTVFRPTSNRAGRSLFSASSLVSGSPSSVVKAVGGTVPSRKRHRVVMLIGPKSASVSTWAHSAIRPARSPCLRSLMTRQGCAAPLT